jgi:hypothetical protein
VEREKCKIKKLLRDLTGHHGRFRSIYCCFNMHSYFFLVFVLQLLRVYKKRPDLIIPSRLQLNENERNYTFDINLIAGIGFTAWGFAEGTYLICNIILFFFFNKEYLDIFSLIPLTIVYTIFLASAFYGFMIRYR